MAPEGEAGPIPTGWTLETEVQKDGSKTPFYYCPGTGQHFRTYSDLTRYVKYAQKKGVGIYAPSCKSLKRKRNKEDDSNAAETRKTSSVLSIPRKPPSNSNSLTVDKKNGSKSAASSESTDKEKDGDCTDKEKDGDCTDKEKDGDCTDKEKDGDCTDKEKDEDCSDKEKDEDCTDKEKDEDYVPEADGDVSAESDADTEKEVDQMKEEMNDLVADNSARR